jgi:hypothetical protein
VSVALSPLLPPSPSLGNRSSPHPYALPGYGLEPGNRAPMIPERRAQDIHARAAPWLCTSCALAMHELRPGYARAAPWLCTSCALAMHALRPGYARAAPWLCTSCALAMHELRPGYARAAPWLCTSCALAMHELRPGITSSTE